jgi:hypothetical protein
VPVLHVPSANSYLHKQPGSQLLMRDMISSSAAGVLKGLSASTMNRIWASIFSLSSAGLSETVTPFRYRHHPPSMFTSSIVNILKSEVPIYSM